MSWESASSESCHWLRFLQKSAEIRVGLTEQARRQEQQRQRDSHAQQDDQKLPPRHPAPFAAHEPAALNHVRQPQEEMAEGHQHKGAKAVHERQRRVIRAEIAAHAIQPPQPRQTVQRQQTPVRCGAAAPQGGGQRDHAHGRQEQQVSLSRGPAISSDDLAPQDERGQKQKRIPCARGMAVAEAPDEAADVQIAREISGERRAEVFLHGSSS